MNKINDKMILKITDTFNDAALLYYHNMINEDYDNTRVTNYNIEKGRLNYYESLLKIIDYFLEIDDLDSSYLDENVIDKIKLLFKNLDDAIEEEGLNSEEMRKALLLLDIKGFKNLNYSLDLITPDNIGLIIAKFITTIFDKKNIKLLDFNVGVGNLIFTIINNIDNEVDALGIDNHALMAQVAISKVNLLDAKMVIYHQDALEILPHNIDLIVSDIATYDYENENYTSFLYENGVRYFPYLAIEHYLQLQNKCIYIYLVDNNFFTQKKSDIFKKFLDETVSIKAFIALPLDMFQLNENAKSILIMTNEPSEVKHIPIYMLPSLSNTAPFMETIADILKELKKI